MLFCVKHGAFIRTQTDGALVPETAFWSVVETVAGNQQKWPKIAINGLNLGGVSEVVKACGMLNLIGSPVWTRFELLRLKARSSRTTSIAFRSMTSIPNRSTHPDWVPSRDESRTTREPAIKPTIGGSESERSTLASGEIHGWPLKGNLS